MVNKRNAILDLLDQDFQQGPLDHLLQENLVVYRRTEKSTPFLVASDSTSEIQQSNDYYDSLGSDSPSIFVVPHHDSTDAHSSDKVKEIERLFISNGFYLSPIQVADRQVNLRRNKFELEKLHEDQFLVRSMLLNQSFVSSSLSDIEKQITNYVRLLFRSLFIDDLSLSPEMKKEKRRLNKYVSKSGGSGYRKAST